MNNFDQIIHCLDSLSNNPDPQVQTAARSFIETNLAVSSPLHSQVASFLTDPGTETRYKLLVLSSVKSMVRREARDPDTNQEARYIELLKLYMGSYYFISNERTILVNYIDILASLMHMVATPALIEDVNSSILAELDTYEKNKIFKALMMLKSMLLDEIEGFEVSDATKLRIYDKLVDLALRYMSDFCQFKGETLEANTDQYNYWIFELIARIVNRLIVALHKAHGDRIRLGDLLKYIDGLSSLNFYDPDALSQTYVLMNDNADESKFKRLLRAKVCGMKLLNWLAKHKAKSMEQSLCDKVTVFTKTLDIFLMNNSTPSAVGRVKKLLYEYLLFLSSAVSNISAYHTVDSLKNVMLLKIARKVVAACVEVDMDALDYAIALDRIFDMHSEQELMSVAFRLYYNLTEVIEGYLAESLELLISELISATDEYNKTRNQSLVLPIHADLLLLASLGESSKLNTRLVKQILALISGITALIVQTANESLYIMLGQILLCKNYLIPVFRFGGPETSGYSDFLSKYIELVLLGLAHSEDGIKYAAQEAFKFLYETAETFNLPVLEHQLAKGANYIFGKLIATVGGDVSFYPIECLTTLLQDKSTKLDIEHVVQAVEHIKGYAQACCESNVDRFIALTTLIKHLLTYSSMSIEAIECVDQSLSQYYSLAFESSSRDLIEDAILGLLTEYASRHKYCSYTVSLLVDSVARRSDTISDDYLLKFLVVVVDYAGANLTHGVFNSLAAVLLLKLDDLRAVYTLHLLIAKHHKYISVEFGHHVLSSVKSQFLKVQDIGLRAGYVILELLVVMHSREVVAESEANFMQLKEHIDDYVIFKNSFFSSYERQTLLNGLLYFLSLGQSLQVYGASLHSILVVVINHLQIYEKFTSEGIARAKKSAPNVSKKSNVQIDTSDSDSDNEQADEGSLRIRLTKTSPKCFNQKFFERREAFVEPFIVFKDFIRYFKQNSSLYDATMSRLPSQYLAYVKDIASFEAVVVDKEKGITEKRKIVKLKPRANN